MAKPPKSRLTPLQRAFVREYVSSKDPHVRGNATAAYLAAGAKVKTEKTAGVIASQTLGIPRVQAAVQAAHAQADAEMLLRLVDWKTAAIAAQSVLLGLTEGYLPEGRMETPLDVARGHVMVSAIKEVMDRGFPKQLYLKFDPREALAKLLGVPRERLPESWEEDA